MKIRMGFVSNSSSTSYVIALTRDFKATPEQLEKFIDECKGYEEDSVAMTSEQATKTIALIVEELCKVGDWSWADSYDITESAENMEQFHNFRYTCGDSFQIGEADGGHGCDFLHNILADDLKDKTLELTKVKNEDT
jgi:hypothetical protein